MYYWLRLHYKLFLKRFRCIDSFCKVCGRTAHDFSVSDNVWKQVSPYENGSGILCYDCFCEKTSQKGFPCVWKLEPIV
jgi:hypothetical protein